MSAASYEMTELLREVQKLQKELQPVRSAITALQKRETETPNPIAAGASLQKVTARLEAVRGKYTPYLQRLLELISDEVPALLQQTPLLGMGGDDILEAAAAVAPPGEATRGLTTADAAAASPKRSGAADTTASPASAAGEAEGPLRLLRDVCPAATPHLLQPANVRFTQQQLRLRGEMVEYLIATDRIDIADHVARAYGLPLQWFPRLVTLHRERAYGAALQIGVTGGEVHSPTGGSRGSSSTPTASPHITPATRPRGAGASSQSPMQLPASAVQPRANSVTSTPTVTAARSPAARAASVSSEPLPPAARPPVQQRSAASASAALSPANGSWVAEDKVEMVADAPAPLMPDLVARVVSAAMYLKDDYFDRMVLERVLEQSVELAPPLERAPGAAAAAAASSLSSQPEDGASLTPAEQHRACVLSRIAHLPVGHLHTQSGDPVFDSAMMNVVEELLVYGLQRWAEDDTATFDAAADAQRGVVAAEVLAAETKKRKADLLRTLTTDSLLTAEEMLLADKVWNEDILFLKRPTRFYCVETGLSSDESAGLAGAAPRARSTGEIVSQLVAEAQNPSEVTTGIFVT